MGEMVAPTAIPSSSTTIREEAHKKYRSKRLQEAYVFLSTITFGGETEDGDVYIDESFLDESSSPARCTNYLDGDPSSFTCKRRMVSNMNSIDEDGRHKVHFDHDHECTDDPENPQSSYLNPRELAKGFFHLSPSAYPKSTKLSGKRVVLITPSHLPFELFSIVPYRRAHITSTTDSSRASSFTNIPQHSTSSLANIYIENIDFSDGNQEVSYKHMLNPARYRRATICSEMDMHPAGENTGESSLHEVEQVLLDDPELMSGKHRTVLNLPSFIVSIVQYAKPAKVKKDINERFKEEFPAVTITLTKLRSLKAEMIAISQKMLLDVAVIACSFVYFEKAVLKTKITKHNRKCIAGACLLLAIKFCDDIYSKNIKACMEAITDQFRLSPKEIVCCELQLLVLLEFSLVIPMSELTPVYKRLEVGIS